MKKWFIFLFAVLLTANWACRKDPRKDPTSQPTGLEYYLKGKKKA